MKKVLLVIFSCLVFMGQIYAESCIDNNGNGKKGSITISKTNISINQGDTTSFVVNAPCAAGRIDIKSSNPNIIKLSTSSEFLDNSSTTINVTGLSVGNAVITVYLTDMADYQENVITGNKTINVSVKGEQGQINDNPQDPVKVVKEMSVTSFKIVGYDIDFDKNKYDYTIDVSENLKELYIIVDGDGIETIGDGVVNIINKDLITVTIKNDSFSYDYKIHINRVTNSISKVETKTNNIFLYTTIFFGLTTLILLILLIKSKKKKESIVNEMKTPQVNTLEMIDLSNNNQNNNYNQISQNNNGNTL